MRLSSLRQTRTNFGVAAVAPTHGPAFYPFAFKPGFHYFPIIRNSPSRAPRRGEATIPAFAFHVCYILSLVFREVTRLIISDDGRVRKINYIFLFF